MYYSNVFEPPGNSATSAVPEEDALGEVDRLKFEIMTLKAKILQLEIEKRGGVIDTFSSLSSQSNEELDSASSQQSTATQSTASIAIEKPNQSQAEENAIGDTHRASSIPMEEDTQRRAMCFCPPHSASPPLPPPLPPRPILSPSGPNTQAEVEESSFSMSQKQQNESPAPSTSRKISHTLSDPTRYHSNPHPDCPNVTPKRQQTSPSLAALPNIQEPESRHASLSPTDHHKQRRQPPPLPPRNNPR